ncbi:hypothetical protein J3Q64DRAFT_1706515 [Phycomyces blakesleeanus]|uniref:PDEase domain-containing protein n=1 Tax=Phycomyces blakesleeanus TaxID=4837 RepID=A0ABR3BC75_PHYBL
MKIILFINIVQTYSDVGEAIEWIQCQSIPTLLLVDLDTIASPVAWINHTRHELKELVNRVPIIVYSSTESSEFMIDCINAGAADYLLKPLRPEVIKTLFLRLYSFHPGKSRDEITPPIPVCDRIKQMFAKDEELIKAIVERHAPRVTQSNYHKLSNERTVFLKQLISSWDFCPLDLEQNDLIYCVVLIFEQVFLLPELSQAPVTQAQLYHFILDLSRAYHDQNPYHNFAHAVDVLQCTYYMLCTLGVLSFADTCSQPNDRKSSNSSNTWPQSLLRTKDVYALLIAAIGHDAAHPGVNNLFMINSDTPLALLYNDCSVLESFHAMTLFQVIKRHGFDKFAGGVGSSEYQEFRKRVVTSILATDMAHHGDYVIKIKEQATRLRTTLFHEMCEAECEKERLLLCSAIIKCADISNVARPYTQAAKWAELLVEEFACQGDLERELGMPVLPLNDRDKIVLEDSQIGFIRYVTLDLFSSVADVMQEISFAVDHMQRNLKRWEIRKNALHDSGVSSLGDIYESEAKGVLQEMEYTRAPNSGQLLRLSMESQTNDGLFKLPSMPAMAMSDYGNHGMANTKPYHINQSQEDPMLDNWTNTTGSRGGPALCQCTIQ